MNAVTAAEPTDGASAAERAEAYLARRGATGTVLHPIQGDASTRSYFRAGIDVGRTEVLLVEAAPGPEPLAPFLSNARFLDAQGLAPPRILDECPELGVLALEDLGDVSLRRALEAAPDDHGRLRLFADAVDVIVALQTHATRALGPEVHAFHVRFDPAVFARELNMFTERYLRDLVHAEPAGAGKGELDEALAWLARTLAEDASVLTHRDFHIDNLFVTDGRLRLIDFQDARWGPRAYDLASLLNDRDVHRFLPAGAPAELFRRFVESRRLDPDEFAREYRLAVVQRSLKATGTFADQALRRGRTDYLRFIAPTLARAREAALRFAELAAVVRVLESVGELDREG